MSASDDVIDRSVEPALEEAKRYYAEQSVIEQAKFEAYNKLATDSVHSKVMLYKKFYDELLAASFTESQSMEIIVAIISNG